jgi:glutathione S-transferase
MSEPAAAPLVLAIGNRNYSSWSLRAWLALKFAGLVFEEVLVRLDEADRRPKILAHSPSGRVPVLKHGDLVIPETLAIIEYAAELRPEAGLWPSDRAARATARSVAAEMHAGFASLRQHMPMNLRRSAPGRGHGAGVDADIARITEIFRDCRARFAAGGPFLFGRIGAADAMFAPVLTRFRTYGVRPDPVSQAYLEAVLERPEFLEWERAARAETWLIAEDEVA